MDERTYLEMKGLSHYGATINIEVRINFEEQPDQKSLLVRVDGEMEHTYDHDEKHSEIEYVEGTWDPKTRKLVLIGGRRTGKFPKGQPPPKIDEHCDECDCNAFRSGCMLDLNRPCFCGHEIKSHQNRPPLSHLVILAQYNFTLPENLSEKFDAIAQSQREPDKTAELQFWEDSVVVKPATR